MIDYAAFNDLSPTTLADALSVEQVMDIGIRPLWQPMPRIAGPAYPVRCAPGDNLMLHAAIYRAPPGAIIVVQAGDLDYAVSGGNVCAVANKRGIAGFVVDGVIHYCVTNMPGAVPRSASQALAASMSPYLASLVRDDWRQDARLAGAINIDAGRVVHPALLN